MREVTAKPTWQNRVGWLSSLLPQWCARNKTTHIADATQDLVREIAAGAALQACNHTIFKLEDIAMGSWIEYIAQRKAWTINYDQDVYFNFHGCQSTDIVSHYIKPEHARCMFEHLPDSVCCSKAEARKYISDRTHRTKRQPHVAHFLHK